MNVEGGNMYTTAKLSLSSIFRVINALFSFLGFCVTLIFPRIFWINVGMSDWCFFLQHRQKLSSRKKK